VDQNSYKLYNIIKYLAMHFLNLFTRGNIPTGVSTWVNNKTALLHPLGPATKTKQPLKVVPPQAVNCPQTCPTGAPGPVISLLNQSLEVSISAPTHTSLAGHKQN